MADRFPLILNTSNNQIQEIASGDNLDLTGTGISNAGIITAGNVTIGAATTDLLVNGNARVTGILTVGTGSLTLDGPNNLVNVGTALTLGHTQGVQFHTQNLHSAGFEVNQINASGIITATTFKGDGDFVELDVDGHTNLDNVSIAGITTMSGNLNVVNTSPFIDLTDTDHNSDYKFLNDNGTFKIQDMSNSNAVRYQLGADGKHYIYGDTAVMGSSNLTVGGNLSVGGVLTYEDVTNIDSVGIITARTSIKLDADGSSSSNFLSIGADDDLKIFHQSNVDKIESSANGFHIRQINNGDLHIHAGANTGSANNRLVARAAGKAELYYAGALKLSTETGGVHITGVCTATSFVGDGSNLTGIDTDLVADSSPQLGGDLDTNSYEILLDDNHAVKWGNNTELEIRHTGSSGYTSVHNAVGNFLIDTTGNFYVRNTNGSKISILATPAGATTLYHDNTPKLQTEAGGINVKSPGSDWNTIERTSNGYYGFHFKKEDGNSNGFLGFTGGGSEINQYSAAQDMVIRSETNITLSKGYNTRLLKTDGNGAVRLFYGNAEKFVTSSSGVTITGQVTATDFKYSSHPGVASLTGNGSTTTITIASGHNVNSVLVVYNGVVLTPTTDYTISGTTLTLQFTPGTNSQVVVRYLIK